MNKELKIDQLAVKILNSRKEMGKCAADDVIGKIKELLAMQDEVNIIFAAAPSQDEFLYFLAEEKNIEWPRVNAFHMDEYLGLDKNHPARFGNFLKERIFDKVSFKSIFYLNKDGYEPDEEIRRYAALLQKYPPDVVCMGIGENAHIAFNDPHVADFKDPKLVKLVQLEEASRMQQVHDECFDLLEEVPEMAVTLTVPMLMSAKYVYCIVPGINKAEAVYHTMNDKISEGYPSTILRRHPNATLYLDQESANKLIF